MNGYIIVLINSMGLDSVGVEYFFGKSHSTDLLIYILVIL